MKFFWRRVVEKTTMHVLIHTNNTITENISLSLKLAPVKFFKKFPSVKKVVYLTSQDDFI